VNLWEKHGPVLPDALIEARLGDRIAAGSFRTAYAFSDDANYVVKCANGAQAGDNQIEWQVWRAVRKTALADSFGRIVAISESGRMLIMEKLDSITPADYALTPSTPAWLADVRPDSFGRSASGVIKLRDFGSLKFDCSVVVRKRWQRD
jgi:hypothetical protein